MRWGVALGVLAGCYAPQPPAGAPCPANGTCPTGLVCSPATNTCEKQAVMADARHPDGSTIIDIDAAIDARPLDAFVANAPKLVQQNTNYADNAGTLSVTLATAPVSGHLLIMIGATPSGSLTSVSGGGATWNAATGSFVNANEEIYYGITNGTSATVTIARTGSTSPIWLSVSEWSGLATTGVLVDAKSKDGTTTAANPGGSVITTGATLLVFGASNNSPNTFGTPTPGTWTALTPISGFQVQSEWYRVEPTAGTYSVSVSQTANAWDASLAAFRYTP